MEPGSVSGEVLRRGFATGEKFDAVRGAGKNVVASGFVGIGRDCPREENLSAVSYANQDDGGHYGLVPGYSCCGFDAA
jgi:hypothetical protein